MSNRWYEKGEAGDGIVVSTRVRLARNLKDYPFPGRLSPEKAREILDNVSEILCGSAGGAEFSLIDMERTDAVTAEALVERHVISPVLRDSRLPRGVIVSRDESVAVMVGEEDHIRIQALGAGLCLEQCMEAANRVDDLLESRLSFAWSEKLGYLTRCPTNLGTGLRVSVMLHLPALRRTGEINRFAAALGKLGFAVRGLYGEGTAPTGDLYQISNQTTLGPSEQELAEKLADMVKAAAEREKAARAAIEKQDELLLEDAAWRAWGILKNARRMGSREAMGLLSDLRLGVALGKVPEADTKTLTRLLFEIQPAQIRKLCGEKDAGDRARDIKRAELIREALA